MVYLFTYVGVLVSWWVCGVWWPTRGSGFSPSGCGIQVTLRSSGMEASIPTSWSILPGPLFSFSLFSVSVKYIPSHFYIALTLSSEGHFLSTVNTPFIHAFLFPFGWFWTYLASYFLILLDWQVIFLAVFFVSPWALFW